MAKSENNIILVGPMGVGKTTIARRLSRILKRDFFDSDAEIIANTGGVSIEHIFEVEGERGFRQRETKTLTRLCEIPNIIIATGGGIVIKAENRTLIKRNSFVVYLFSSVAQLLSRTANSKKRPLLNESTNPEKTLTDLLNARDKYYKEVADVVVDTTEKEFYDIINEIKNLIPKG